MPQLDLHDIMAYCPSPWTSDFNVRVLVGDEEPSKKRSVPVPQSQRMQHQSRDVLSAFRVWGHYEADNHTAV